MRLLSAQSLALIVIGGVFFLLQQDIFTPRHRDPCKELRFLSDLEMPDMPSGTGNVTIVIPGHSADRKPYYECMLREYRSMCGLVSHVIVVWNNADIEPPTVPSRKESCQCDIPVTILRSKRNSLNNRFVDVVPHVKSAAVYSVDDDMIVSYPLLACMFSHWSRNRDRIVGSHPRMITDTGDYVTSLQPEYNIALTGSALFDSRFLSMYAAEKKVHEFVDTHMNGEDILFNAIVQRATKTSPLYVKPTGKTPLAPRAFLSKGGLHSKTTWPKWLAARSEIGRFALAQYGDDVFQTSSERPTCPGLHATIS